MLSNTKNNNTNTVYSSPPTSPSKCIEIKYDNEVAAVKLTPTISYDESCSNHIFDPSKMSPPNSFMDKLIARRGKYN